MKRRIFCSVCGNEVTNDLYKIVIHNRTDKDVPNDNIVLCENDYKKVKNLKFKPCTRFRTRKMPSIYTVSMRHAGKQKGLYLINSWELPQIYQALVPVYSLLHDESGRPYFTSAYVKQQIDTNDDKVLRYCDLLYTKQTQDEKATYTTKHHNNVGFNKPDAQRMSAYARLTHDGKVLSAAQLEDCRRRLYKYTEQIANILNESLE